MAYKSDFRRTRLFSTKGFINKALVLTAICLMALTLTKVAFPQGNTVQQGEREKGTRSSSTRPKTPSAKRQSGQTRTPSTSRGVDLLRPENLYPILASADFNLIGLAVTAGPDTQAVPKNTPTIIQTSVQTPAGVDPQTVIAGLNPNYRVRGELTGPSFTSPLTVEAQIGQPLNIPPLPNGGDHVVQNLRVVDLGLAEQPVVSSVTPDSCGILVIEQVLVTQVQVQELNYNQIVNSGISINDDSYQYFNFILGLSTSSSTQNVQIPVAFPPTNASNPIPVIGTPSAPVGVPVPDVFPIMLEPIPGSDVTPPEIQTPQSSGLRIPGIIVFPGRVGFLQQHFEAIVIVSNGTPSTSNLVVKELKAKIALPDSGSQGPPLAIAATQTGGQVSELAIHGLGPDGRYGTSDDTTVFPSGAGGQASFLLRGIRQGLHTINFDLTGKLEGLPGGPINIRGQISGAVLVRDASIAVSFTHPSVVNKNQEYDLSMTLYNQGDTDIQGAIAQLASGSIIGASLLEGDNGDRSFPTTILAGESATISWRLRANRTGTVTASYVTINNGASASFGLVTGVAANGVPLSPDSLVLPEPSKYLPANVLDAARSVLGQAWSIATAPAGSLPAGVKPISKQTVRDKAIDLGIAGLRIRFGEPVHVSIATLMRDWLGDFQSGIDVGFADLLRNTSTGYRFYDTVGTYYYSQLLSTESDLTPLSLHTSITNAEMPRSAFISALVSQENGTNIVGASFVDNGGKRVGFKNSDERSGDITTGGALRLTENPNVADGQSLGQLLSVSSPGTSTWTLELTGWQSGTVNLSLVIPLNTTTYRQVIFNNINILQGGRYRIVFRPQSTTTLTLQEFRDGSFQNLPVTPTENILSQPQPQVVGAVQVSPEVLDGGDKYGRLIGVLFSKPMSKESIQSAAGYQISNGTLITNGEQISRQIRVTGSTANYGDRFAFLALDAPVGPYITRNVIVSGVNDKKGLRINQDSKSIVATVSPRGVPSGAYLTGKVLSADGTVVPNAAIAYWTQPCGDGFFIPSPVPISTIRTNAEGFYSFDYVRDGDCGPVIVSATHPVTNSTKQLQSSVLYDGQNMVLDPVFLARGKIQGTVTLNNNPAPDAYVRVVPELEVAGTQLVRTNFQGQYTAQNLPVGNVSVLAIGYGTQSNATGLAVGEVRGDGVIPTVNVALNSISGIISGRVVFQNGSLTPSSGSLVIAYANFSEVDGLTDLRSVGYAFTDRDGKYTIRNLPLKNIVLRARDAAGHIAFNQVLLTESYREATGILLSYPSDADTFGSITGKVLSEDGTPINHAKVTLYPQSVRTNAEGSYTLNRVARGNHTVAAFDPNTNLFGTANVTVQPNQAANVNIIISRPATITGRVHIQRGSNAPEPVQDVAVKFGHLQTYTDSQGAYTLRNVAGNTSGKLVFIHPNRNLAINQTLVIASGETVERNATFKPSTVRGKIYKPDGVTGTVAQLKIATLRPNTDTGYLVLQESVTQSLSDGSYQINDMNAGSYRITASNFEFPNPVSNSGSLGSNETQQRDIILSNQPSRIQGRIFQPDGTPVGATAMVTLGNDTFPEIAVPTDESGHYEFNEVVPEGVYYLTATEQVTRRTNRITVAIYRNNVTTFDITLLGTGNLNVNVVDASGNPVNSGKVKIQGLTYPFDERDEDIDTTNNGVFAFKDLSKGVYVVNATRQGLGGGQQVFINNNATTNVTIQLQPSGTINGRVLMPDGTTGVGLADVSLIRNDSVIGVVTSADDETNHGSFSFQNVPSGSFTLEAFDNRTGRRGRINGTITQQGEIVNLDVRLVAIGAVTGQVTANGAPLPNVLVEIYSFNAVQGGGLQSTTDQNGRYRFPRISAGPFTVKVLNAPGGLTGQASGLVQGTTEPLPDTIADIALQPSATFVGTVIKSDGSAPIAGARVTIISNQGTRTAIADENGRYRFDYAPISNNMKIRATHPSSNTNERGEVVLSEAPQPGSTVTIDVQLAGVGSVGGAATDHQGTPLNAGTVTFVNEEWGTDNRFTISAPVQSNGSYLIENAPAGSFTLLLTVPDNSRRGSATGNITANQTLNLPIRLEDSGTVIGRVLKEQSVAVSGADITLTIRRQSDGVTVRRFTHTNSEGLFTLENIPVGLLTLDVNDSSTDSSARVTGRSLNTNGETLNYGDIVLDTLPPTVESITPSNGATNVNPTTFVTVRFSEPVSSATANDATIKITGGLQTLTPRAFYSADGREVYLRKDPYSFFPVWLADETTYTIVVTTQVKDLAGHPIQSEVRAIFTTGDWTGPKVISSTPANGAVQVAVNASLVVNFGEALAQSQNVNEVVRLYKRLGYERTLVETTVTASADRKTLTATPNVPLEDSTRYELVVSEQKDEIGNIGSSYVAQFTTIDQAGPAIEPWKINSIALDGLHLVRRKPYLVILFSDSASGVNKDATILTLDGNQITPTYLYPSQLDFAPQTPLSVGTHTITVKVFDYAGNFSERSATFTIEDTISVDNIAPPSGLQTGGTRISLTGSGLENTNQSSPQVFIGGNASTVIPAYYYGDCDFGRCLTVIAPPGTPGPADIVIQTDHGTLTLPGAFTYEVDTRTPFVAEQDTLLLLHLEEIRDRGECPQSLDAGPYGMDTSCYGVYLDEGRFGSGVFSRAFTADGYSPETNGLMAFSDTGFTLEGWFKTDPQTVFEQPQLLMGRGDTYDTSSDGDYTLKMLPDGSLQARLLNENGDVWETTMSFSVYPFNDGQWHYVAMVVERGVASEQNRLVIYVDGEERAATTAPPNFGSIRRTISAGFGSSFNGGSVDEIRVSSTAHTAAQIQQIYQNNTFALVSASQTTLLRGTTNQLSLYGYKLKDANVSVTAPNGSAIPVTVQVTSRTTTQLQLSVDVGESATPGAALLSVTLDGQTESKSVSIAAPNPFTVDASTLLLWHMNETSTPSVTDAGPFAINGNCSFYPDIGRFGNGRISEIRAATNPSVLSFGTSSFTIEMWLNTNYRPSGFGGYDYIEQTLFKKGNVSQSSDTGAFRVSLLPSGELKAQLRDSAGELWEAQTQTSYAEIFNGQWHYISLVVKRGTQPDENRLTLYVDGVARGTTVAPVLFGTLRETADIFRSGESVSTTIDEVRILNRARTATQIENTWLGISSSVEVATQQKRNKKSVRAKMSNHAKRPATLTNLQNK